MLTLKAQHLPHNISLSYKVKGGSSWLVTAWCGARSDWLTEVLSGKNRCCVWSGNFVSLSISHLSVTVILAVILTPPLTWQNPSKRQERRALQREPAAARLHHPQHGGGRGNCHLCRSAPEMTPRLPRSWRHLWLTRRVHPQVTRPKPCWTTTVHVTSAANWRGRWM